MVFSHFHLNLLPQWVHLEGFVPVLSISHGTAYNLFPFNILFPFGFYTSQDACIGRVLYIYTALSNPSGILCILACEGMDRTLLMSFLTYQIYNCYS